MYLNATHMYPKYFDLFLMRLREATSITSQAGLAKALSISRAAITQAKKNDSVPQRWITLLSQAHNLNPEWLEKGTGEKFFPKNIHHEFLRVPKIMARLSAGGGSFETEAEIKEFYSFRKDWLRTKGNANDMVLMDIVGNSMEPELKDGDTVLIDQSQRSILAGAIYAVGLSDIIVIKRLEKRPQELLLLSENKMYPIMRLEGDEMNRVRIIGKVLWACRELN